MVLGTQLKNSMALGTCAASPSDKEPACNAGDAGNVGSIPESERSPGEGHGNPLQYSCLENPWMEESGRLQSMGLQSRTLLSDVTVFLFLPF